MIRNKSGFIPTRGTCNECGEEFPILDTIQTKRRGRVCLDCWTNEDKND